MVVPKLTTMAACRAVGLNRDRLNEHIHAGNFDCAPRTVAGRARLFTPDDLLALLLFRQNLDDGMPAGSAGGVACAVAEYARLHPDEPVIANVTYSVGISRPAKPSEVPSMDQWGFSSSSGMSIRKVEYFNIAYLRRQVDHAIEEERSIIGEPDE